jgi:hypothetical protein
MAKEYTYEDMPNTLNSISWQLKRIADALENIDSTLEQEVEVKDEIKQGNHLVGSTKLTELLRSFDKK